MSSCIFDRINFESNLSRYVYNLYECQFFFDKPTHSDSIDIANTPTVTDKYDVSFNYKFSNMIFERYSPSIVNTATASFVDNGTYKSISNRELNPLTQSFTSFAVASKSTTVLDSFTEKESQHPSRMEVQSNTSPPTGTANAYKNFMVTQQKSIYQNQQVEYWDIFFVQPLNH